MKRLFLAVVCTALSFGQAEAQCPGGMCRGYLRAPVIYRPQIVYRQYEYDRSFSTPRLRPVFPYRQSTIRDRLWGPRVWHVYRSTEGGK